MSLAPREGGAGSRALPLSIPSTWTGNIRAGGGLLGGRPCRAPKNKKDTLSGFGAVPCVAPCPEAEASPDSSDCLHHPRMAGEGACLLRLTSSGASCCCFALWSARPLPGIQTAFRPSHAPIKNCMEGGGQRSLRGPPIDCSPREATIPGGRLVIRPRLGSLAMSSASRNEGGGFPAVPPTAQPGQARPQMERGPWEEES